MLALGRRRSPSVVIIGAGFGGLAAAVALRRRGIDDLLIIERSDGVGGTWRQNSYPGAACDIQSHLYSFSFAPNRRWARTYAYQPEILAYLESVADDFDLRRHMMLDTSVRKLTWNEQAAHWEVELGDRTVVADVVVCAVGLFGAARYPDIKGLTDFTGDLMHTSQWDATVDLSGKRVAVIGTGASGVQVIPELASTAAQLTVFQRTPPWMVPKPDRPFTAEELARFRRYPWASARERWRLWKLQHDNTALTPGHPQLAVAEDLSKNFLRRHVADEALRDALTPRYPFRCKRVLLGEKYYTALQHPHVDLVTDPIDRITGTSVVTSGGSVDVDAIVLATGFETSRYLSGLDVIGVGGQKPARPLGSGSPRLSRGGSQRVSELLHALRPEHQPGCQFDHLRPGGGRTHGGQRGEPTRATGRLPRCASRGRAPVQRADLRRSRADHLDPLRQLLPIADRPHRHPVAALGTRLCKGDMANTVTRLGAPDRRAVTVFCRVSGLSEASWSAGALTRAGEPTQRGNAGDRRYGFIDLIAGRDERFELRQDGVHRPDHRIGQREVAFRAIDGLVESLGSSRQILYEIGN